MIGGLLAGAPHDAGHRPGGLLRCACAGKSRKRRISNSGPPRVGKICRFPGHQPAVWLAFPQLIQPTADTGLCSARKSRTIAASHAFQAERGFPSMWLSGRGSELVAHGGPRFRQLSRLLLLGWLAVGSIRVTRAQDAAFSAFTPPPGDVFLVPPGPADFLDEPADLESPGQELTLRNQQVEQLTLQVDELSRKFDELSAAMNSSDSKASTGLSGPGGFRPPPQGGSIPAQDCGNRYLGKLPLDAYFEYGRGGIGLTTKDQEFLLGFRGEVQTDYMQFGSTNGPTPFEDGFSLPGPLLLRRALHEADPVSDFVPAELFFLRRAERLRQFQLRPACATEDRSLQTSLYL